MSCWSDIPGSGRVNLVEALSVARDLPVEALERAAKEPGRIAPDVLRVAERAADGAELTEREGNLLFWGVHVLAACRETRLLPPLLRILRRPADEVGELLGDAIAQTLPRVVASAYDGDAEALEAAILDRDADEFVRWSLFGALAFLAFEGRIGRERTHAFLLRFDDERPARAGDATWTGWEQAIALLGFADLGIRVAAARADARLLDDISDPEWFDATLADALAQPADPSRFRDAELGYLEDVVGELEAALADDEDAPPAEPVRNPFRDVGRNDSCPCGSGRKFKACCLRQEPR